MRLAEHLISFSQQAISGAISSGQDLGKPRILSLFLNSFNKFNNTGGRMLDSIYYMTSKILKNHIFWLENVRFPLFLHNVIWTSLHNVTKSVNH